MAPSRTAPNRRSAIGFRPRPEGENAALVRLELLLSTDEIANPRLRSESHCIMGKLSKKAVVRDMEQVAVAHDVAQQ